MENKSILVGFGRKDITPDFSVPLAGYGNNLQRMSQGYLNRLYATCIAITGENGETALLYTLDLLGISHAWSDPLRKAVSEATGVLENNIVLCCTHTHSGPDVLSTIKQGSEYQNLFNRAVIEAGVEAVNDRAEGKIMIGTTEVSGLAYTRHYYLDNGSVVGDNFGDPSSGEVVSHTCETDNQMQLIRFVRGGGKKDVLMVNWQAHPTVSSTLSYEISRATRPFLSADYVGSCRSYVEQKTDMLFAFFQGAGGNINPKSMIREENPTNYFLRYGNLLGDFVIKGLESLSPTDSGDVKTLRRNHIAECDHSDDSRLNEANEIKKLWLSTNNPGLCTREAKKYGMHSPYHAMSITYRSTFGESRSLELNAISAGNISFIAAPYEMFCTNGKYIKENSPYEMTFIMSCANHYHSYLASELAFEHGCYEVDARYFVKGTAEKVADDFVDMLEEIK